MIIIMSKAISDLFEKGRTVSLKPGQTVFRTGDPSRSMYLVVQGQIDLVRHTSTGSPLILSRAGPDNVLAEASAYSDFYHCDGTANEHSHLLSVPVSEFRDVLHGSSELSRLWSAQLASALQKARTQSEIRTLKTVSERLDAWLADSQALPAKGKIQGLAHILGVSREALYRELAKRRT